MPLSDLEVVTEELLEAKDLRVSQVCFFQALLPLIDQLQAIRLGEPTCHGDVAGCKKHVALHGVILAIEHASADDPLLLLCVQAFQEVVCATLSHNQDIDLDF